MPDSRTYRGAPPYAQGNANDSALDRLVKMGVTDMQAPYRPDPMDAVTANIGNGQFLPDSLSTREAGDVAQTAGLDLYVPGAPIDMADASSGLPMPGARDNNYGDGREVKGGGD